MIFSRKISAHGLKQSVFLGHWTEFEIHLNLHLTHMCFSTACLPIGKAGCKGSLEDSLDQRSGSEPAEAEERIFHLMDDG